MCLRVLPPTAALLLATDDPAGDGSCPADGSLRQALAGAGSGDVIQLAGTAAAPVTYALPRAPAASGRTKLASPEILVHA